MAPRLPEGIQYLLVRLTTRHKWDADDGALVTNTVDYMIVLLDLVDQFSKWPGIHVNVNKCKITAFIQEL